MLRWLSLTLLISLASTRAQAEAMRCGQVFVKEGSSAAQVRATCGVPTREEVRVERHAYSVVGEDGRVITHWAEILVEDLHYDFGPNEFVYDLTFHDGQMVRMVKGSWGKAR